ncbi:hypothetical protein QBC35DRAFT_79402 [Podospora australis]|uniref:LRR-containing protein second PH domain-containing protein n=1 Tax=Podospora australis TaxID=1536484 RepID=A0AAN6WZ91_9PEZI|nr:hypothetical protein QBC35DRAFT_79402 [Podospora australis]
MPISTSRDPQARRKTRTGIAPLTAAEFEEAESNSSLSSTTTTPSSPISSDGGDHRRTFSLNSIKSKALRSLSSSHEDRKRDIALDGLTIINNTPGHGFRSHARKLSKSRPYSPTASRRGSGVSEDHIHHLNRGRLSFSMTTDTLSLTNSSTASSIDWRSQRVEGAGPLESDTTLLKTKTPYLVVTSDYLVKVKSRSDAIALFPCLAMDGERQKASQNPPEPVLAIPTSSIISAFPAESTRPSFGIEVWWKGLTGNSFYRSDFFFNLPKDRNEHLYHIIRAMRVAHEDDDLDMDYGGGGDIRRCADVEGLLSRIQDIEEPKFKNRKLEIFPVVPRGQTRKEFIPKAEEATKKPQEGSAFYLVVGMYLCYFVEVHRGSKSSGNGGGEPTRTYRTFGLVTLESFKGEWTRHEERFIISFREPFQQPVTLELASRHYRQIIRVFGQADRFLKPVWPQMWQTMEIFWVTGLKEVQYLVSREDYGSVKRTLDAYLAAYRCPPVDWEINWKTRFAPEFRLLPGKNGSQYTPLQILAVLRALRYNDYFNSLSFRNVDLSVLNGQEDNTLRKVNVAYLSRTCMTLNAEEVEILRISPVLHQEFHALVFCSETIRQIDFTNCSRSLPEKLRQMQGSAGQSLQFLTPILNALRSGITKCDRLLLGGNVMPRFDIDDIAETMKLGVIQALDIGYCGLDDMCLRDMIVTPLAERPVPLQSLSISGNPGRLPAYILPQLLYHLPEIRDLELGGSILGDSQSEVPLLPFDTLDYLQWLEKLDISGFKLDEEAVAELERFLRYRSWKMDHEGGPHLRKLVLNHCGITGFQAARLFDAIGVNHGLHLCISGNPIEYGVEELAAAIRANKGPAGLYMEMVEFKHESNYLLLLNAMAETKHLSLLSLAGTAPSPSPLGVCSPELVTALHDFFARNKSIHCLDLSGFSGKLDDSQLTKGFGRSLSGLAKNKTMTHLRIRNQNLHDDAGTLGKVLAENSVLLVLDVQENNLNLTSLRFLVDSMKTNTSIVDCPFSLREQKAIWKNILKGMRRARGGSQGNLKDSHQLKPEEVAVREVLQQQFERLHEYLRRNRLILEAQSGQLFDLESPMTIASSPNDGTSPGGNSDKEEMWPPLALDFDLGGRNALELGENFALIGTEGYKNDSGLQDIQQQQNYNQPPPQRRPTVRSYAIEKVEAPLPMPYHNLMYNGGVLPVESPTETLDPVQEVETPPPDVFSPGDEPDPIFLKMMDQFRAAGITD